MLLSGLPVCWLSCSCVQWGLWHSSLNVSYDAGDSCSVFVYMGFCHWVVMSFMFFSPALRVVAICCQVVGVLYRCVYISLVFG